MNVYSRIGCISDSMPPVKSVPRNKSNRQRERTRVSLICQSVFFRESVGVGRKKIIINDRFARARRAYIDLAYTRICCVYAKLVIRKCLQPAGKHKKEKLSDEV